MRKITFTKLSVLLFILISQISFSQLSNFTLNVIPTNETCLGNGALAFSVANTVPGSSIDYTIYLLPNATTPLIVVTAPILTGLNGGNYLVVATQSLNGSSATKQQNVTILNAIQTLNYTLSSVKVRCGNDGKIQVNVSSGNPSTYQLISGPVTTSQQSSNVFNNLPVGVYQIRVLDACGEALVQTYTLESTPISLIVEGVTFPFAELPSCNTITVSNFLGGLSSFQVAYPLTLQYTIFPPSGAPIIINATINAGTNYSVQNIPFYYNQSYYYNLKVTDACGNIYNNNNNVVNKKLEAEVSVVRFNCTEVGLKIAPNNYVAPYSIDFTSFPVGFNPVAFNTNHPGPFSGIFTLYGSVGNGFPIGTYTVVLTDSCGRSATKTFTVTVPNPMPIPIGSNNGCGTIDVTIQLITMVNVVITSAPAGFPFPLPYNITSYLNAAGNILSVAGYPVGSYTIQVTDSCGIITNIYPVIAPYNPPPLTIFQRPGCELGKGSTIVTSPENIVNAVLTAAPPTYTGSLPMNFNSNLSSGTLVLPNVPQGNYTFTFTSGCGGVRNSIIPVNGYQVTGNSINVTENCGSFNLLLQHASNGTNGQTFWLQKLNIVTGNWVHPANGTIFATGDLPSNLNAISLQNNINNLNLAYSGQFRILKRFFTYDSNGIIVNCVEVINSFNFNGGPKIINVSAVLCASNTNEVVINATGLPPLNYKIITKNGLPFVVNNGTSNSFTNLQPAVYKFEVKDVCTNVVNTEYDITAIAPLNISAVNLCNGQVGSLSVPSFSFLNYQWYKGNNITTILSTTNVLNFSPYNSATDIGVYHVKITNPSATTSCVNTILDYTISSNSALPNAGLDNSVTYCGNQGIIDLATLLSGTFDSGGTWSETSSSGTLNNNLWNSTSVAYGTYNFKYTVSALCVGSDESLITINIKPIPQTPIASVDTILCENEDVILNATNIASGTYVWTGPSGFTSSEQNPILSNANPTNNGTYTVKAILNGCESDETSVIVAINPLPKFTLSDDCFENKYTVTAALNDNSTGLNGISYAWSGPNNYTNSQNPIEITGLPKGVYSLTTTDSFGCKFTQEISVAQTICSIPKGLSPNGDGNNDSFDLSGFDIDNLKIFNRYGMIVYEKGNYLNEWKGQDYNGNVLPSGTYYYQVVLNNGKTETGWVYLQRD